MGRRSFIITLAGFAGATLSSPALWAQTYPTRTVRVIVPLGAGAAADILARQLAQKMNDDWRQPVVVENRPGGGTILGTDIVAKAAPDGHTLLANSASFATVGAIQSKLPYDVLTDFAPVSQIAAAPLVLVVAPSLGAKSIVELIDLAKAKPGEMNFGSAGIGGSSHFATEQLKIAAGINVVHVPYKGAPEVLLETANGRVQCYLAPMVAALPFIRDGRLLALGVTTSTRTPILKEVPTIAEAGLPGYEYQDWWGVFAPGKTPSAVVETISKEIARILERPDIAKIMLDQGVEANGTTPEEFTKFIRAQVTALRELAASAGIRAD
jgi:tripartite-type tricarboxylate transporter receptor subunit TctC